MSSNKNRPLLKNMLEKVRDEKKKAKKSVIQTLSNLESEEFLYCEPPFDPIPVKTEKGLSCKMPNERLSTDNLSLPWSEPSLESLIPPEIYDNTEQNILSNLLGQESLDKITYINSLGRTNALPTKCPPYGFPELSERVEVPEGSGRFICREPYPTRNPISGILPTHKDNLTTDTPNPGCATTDENGNVLLSNDPNNKLEYYVTWDNVGLCRPRVTNGAFHCPQSSLPNHVKHITLPNGYGMCVLDKTLQEVPRIVPFTVIPSDSPLMDKLNLMFRTVLGIKLNKKMIDVFRIVLDNTRNMADVASFKMSLEELMTGEHGIKPMVDLMVHNITNPATSGYVDGLKKYFETNGTYNLMQQILTQVHNFDQLSSLNLVVNHVEVKADIALAKIAINSYATTILKLPPSIPITDSDLAFFGADKKSINEYQAELKQYFDDLYRLSTNPAQAIPYAIDSDAK